MANDLTYYVWPAPATRDNDNKSILPALEKITKAGGSVTVIREGALCDGMVILPFMETPTGERYYGIKSIQYYANSYPK